MKVILLQKIPGVGDIDQVKDVADGYARNFLFPRHLAVQATQASLADLTAHKKKQTKDAERELQTAQNLAERLDGLVLELKEKASEKGQLYAAVSATKIISELKRLGYTILREQIKVPPIKEAGEYVVKIKLSHGLEATVTVIVST
ncbi:MAG: 50S ribosomal protein L9 [Candidatus Magasanikbacteria bacterium RIFOXYC2_FULL_42_28]|uniref:Large ribosomal subunit protein bL9 n=1 Tax=Candidatus Magasanikbacteria bacterium RIFOXYC2_FULL_42_28 TaxID=1798704 RepID=A0A1F6NXE1_9BACT|nr:MAG: 50S ribosomal protein L9 [Candidatus Magasanikbacteria bacterium RIFOXYC2_FULL_42_28]